MTDNTNTPQDAPSDSSEGVNVSEALENAANDTTDEAQVEQEVQNEQDEVNLDEEVTLDEDSEESEEGEETTDEEDTTEEVSDDIEIDGSTYSKEEVAELVKSKQSLDKKVRAVNESVKHFENVKNTVEYSQQQATLLAQGVQDIFKRLRESVPDANTVQDKMTSEGHSDSDILERIKQNSVASANIEALIKEVEESIEASLQGLTTPSKVEQTDMQRIHSLGSHLYSLYPDTFEGYTDRKTVVSEWQSFDEMLQEYGFNNQEVYALLIAQPQGNVIRLLKDLKDLKSTTAKASTTPQKDETVLKAERASKISTGKRGNNKVSWPSGRAKTDVELTQRKQLADKLVEQGTITDAEALKFINGWPRS